MFSLKTTFLLLFCSVSFTFYLGHSQVNDATGLLKKMHERYFKAPCKSYSFSQKNKHYRNDSLVKTSEWHESIEFPDKFLIEFGAKESGNKVIFKNDSVFNYRKGSLVKSGRDSNSLLLLLGGMYYRDFDDAIRRVRAAGYSLDYFSEQQWQGRAVYIIGALMGDESSNQIWVDKKDLTVLRIIEKIDEQSIMDMRFESHTRMCNGYIESVVSFRRNNKLEQVEEYYNIRKTERFPY